MTYKSLLELLKNKSEEELLFDITLHDLATDEYYPCDFMDIAIETDVVEEGTPLICFSAL